MLLCEVDGDWKGTLPPSRQIAFVPRRVLTEHERSCLVSLLPALDDTSSTATDHTACLDRDGRVPAEVEYPVRRPPAVGEQVESVILRGVPDLDAMGPLRATTSRRQVAVLVATPCLLRLGRYPLRSRPSTLNSTATI